MFEFDAGKLIIIGIVALIVIGPKDLPRVMRQVGQAVAKMRRMAGDFRAQLMEAMREAEFEAIHSDMAKLEERAKAGSSADPLAQIKAELTQAIERADEPEALPAAAEGEEPEPRQARSLTLPGEAEEAPALVRAPGIAPLANGINETGPLEHPQDTGGIDAEMRALADALAAEMAEAETRPPGVNGKAAPEM
ncbi:MAG TPA: Sec-independent protein translocase protein TatB [Methylocella sp.]|nr:Sec-independent protein translocase protein TatB [Methylocella sp.]